MGDQVYLCAPGRQKERGHKAFYNRFHRPAIHNRVRVWSLLEERRVVDAQGEFHRGEDRAFVYHPVIGFYMVMFIKKGHPFLSWSSGKVLRSHLACIPSRAYNQYDQDASDYASAPRKRRSSVS